MVKLRDSLFRVFVMLKVKNLLEKKWKIERAYNLRNQGGIQRR